MSSPASIARPAYVISGLIAAVFLLALAAFPGQSSAMEGSFFQAQLAAEQKKCQKKKPKKAKTACLKGVKGKATAATKKAMSGDLGLYGHNLKASQIPSTSGTLIWSKELPTTPGAALTEFVLYSSKSFPGNTPVVVSGTLSIPEGNAPQGGWPVISWAHGTTGIADQCAPSRGGDQGSYGGAEPLIEGWLEDGYAVLATDYEGLGTPGVHPYLVGVSEARGVLDIVRASRTAESSLSKKVIISGHSQGGHAALFAAGEAPKWISEFDHLATVPYAPPANLPLQAQGIGSLPADSYGISALAAMILRGGMVLDSSIKASDILTDEALALFPQVDTKCLGSDPGQLSAAFAEAGVGPGDLLKSTWQGTPSGQAFIQALIAAEPLVTTNRPVLILQGRQDTTVQPGLTDTLVDELRERNGASLIEYLTYGNADNPDFLTSGPSDHSGILADAEAQVDAFLREGFGLPPLPPLPTR